jgi:hypothetical protein
VTVICRVVGFVVEIWIRSLNGLSVQEGFTLGTPAVLRRQLVEVGCFDHSLDLVAEAGTL